eukprot:scaffold15024_cov124-Isochrysis_galbana.AAC.1
MAPSPCRRTSGVDTRPPAAASHPTLPPKRVGAWSAVSRGGRARRASAHMRTCGCNHPYSGEAMPHLQLEGWVVL